MIDEDIFIVYQASGNHKELAKEIRLTARANGCKKILFATWRNGNAFARLINGRVIGYILELPWDQQLDQ